MNLRDPTAHALLTAVKKRSKQINNSKKRLEKSLMTASKLGDRFQVQVHHMSDIQRNAIRCNELLDNL